MNEIAHNRVMKASLFIIILLFTAQAFAKDDSIINLEPVYGVENVTKVEPAPQRTVTRTFYGARLLIGRSWYKGELEYTQGTDDEYLVDTDTNVSEDVKRYRAGLRLRAGNGMISAFLRAGYQRTEIDRTLTVANVVTTEDVPVSESPYAGAGLNIRLANLLSINLGANLSRGPYVDGDRKYNVEYQAGLRFKFGKVR